MRTKLDQFFRGFAPAVLFALFTHANSAKAAIVNVSVINDAFVPAKTNINANDTVIWTWGQNSMFHNVTSDSSPQAWPASATLSAPAAFTNTFTATGTFPYECTVHGFTGSIVVAAALGLPPTVAITAPASNAVFAAPANVTIQASASATGGTITNVQFKVGGIVLSNVATPPYSATVTELPAGAYTLSAIATESNGLKATNSIPITIVAQVSIFLTNAVMASGGFQFDYSATTGLSYVVQRSPDLITWISLVTNTAASSPLTFVDPQATNDAAFYRVLLAPSP